MTPSALSKQLTQESYAVLPGVYDAAWIARVRTILQGVYDDVGAPVPYRPEGVEWLSENVEVSSTGFVLHRLLGFAPELHEALFHPDTIDVIRGALGNDMFLEFAGAVLTNHERPFFRWHHHVGGIDDEKFRRMGWRPAIDRPERVSMLVYLDPMNDSQGELLVYPKRVRGDTDPPFDPEDEHVTDARAIHGPPGTVVLMDQCTWHAVRPCVPREGLRMFVGFWFAAATVPKSFRVDETLFSLETADPLLLSLLPTRHD